MFWIILNQKIRQLMTTPNVQMPLQARTDTDTHRNISNWEQKVSSQLSSRRREQLAKLSGVQFQLEVESAGGSDGTMLQKSDLPIDWCFIGAPEDHVHTPDEKVVKNDIMCMVELYRYLMQHL